MAQHLATLKALGTKYRTSILQLLAVAATGVGWGLFLQVAATSRFEVAAGITLYLVGLVVFFWFMVEGDRANALFGIVVGVFFHLLALSAAPALIDDRSETAAVGDDGRAAFEEPAPPTTFAVTSPGPAETATDGASATDSISTTSLTVAGVPSSSAATSSNETTATSGSSTTATDPTTEETDPTATSSTGLSTSSTTESGAATATSSTTASSTTSSTATAPTTGDASTSAPLSTRPPTTAPPTTATVQSEPDFDRTVTGQFDGPFQGHELQVPAVKGQELIIDLHYIDDDVCTGHDVHLEVHDPNRQNIYYRWAGNGYCVAHRISVDVTGSYTIKLYTADGSYNVNAPYSYRAFLR